MTEEREFDVPVLVFEVNALCERQRTFATAARQEGGQVVEHFAKQHGQLVGVHRSVSLSDRYLGRRDSGFSRRFDDVEDGAVVRRERALVARRGARNIA